MNICSSNGQVSQEELTFWCDKLHLCSLTGQSLNYMKVYDQRVPLSYNLESQGQTCHIGRPKNIAASLSLLDYCHLLGLMIRPLAFTTACEQGSDMGFLVVVAMQTRSKSRVSIIQRRTLDSYSIACLALVFDWDESDIEAVLVVLLYSDEVPTL